jgi:hypothetical protein
MSVDVPNNDERGYSRVQGSEFRLDAVNPLPGIYRAKVEYTADPKRLKRVKIRIPGLHGIPDVTDEFIKTKNLPWADCEGTSTAGYDMGSYIVPKVGSFIWVRFEAGDPSRYVYGGGIHGKNSKEVHQMGLFHEDYDEDKIPAGQWDAPTGENEIPKDAFRGKSDDDNEPTRDVIHKSLKGHTIMMDDEDEKESISIIDRAGQLFRMISPIKNDKNHTGDNSFQRGIKETDPNSEEDQFDYEEDSFQKKAIIVLRDLAGQLFRTVAEFEKEMIEIVAHNFHSDDNRRTALQMNAGKDNVNYMLLSEDEEKDNRVYIKADATNVKLELVVVEGGTEISRIEMTDSIFQYATGEMDVQSIKKMRMHADADVNISADGGKLETYSDTDTNIESSSAMNMKSGATMSRQAGGSIHDKAGGTINHDGSATYLQSGTASGAGSYGGDNFDYEPPDDKTTWEDENPEDYIKE